MEWKFSADKERYGDMIGEVIHHTLFEDGTITKYDVKFGNKTNMLEVVELQEHSHEATEEDDEDDEEKDESSCS
jgi:Ran GTPase-activating protein (RanGAP) involved in mRNA processing and transport